MTRAVLNERARSALPQDCVCRWLALFSAAFGCGARTSPRVGGTMKHLAPISCCSADCNLFQVKEREARPIDRGGSGFLPSEPA